jgi:hypothetical protein
MLWLGHYSIKLQMQALATDIGPPQTKQFMQNTRETTVSCTCSVIDRLLEKLVNEVAMGSVNLNPIKASLDGILGGHTVQLNQPGDLRGVHRPRGWQILEGALLLAIWAEDGVILARNGLARAGWHGLASWLVVCKTVSELSFCACRGREVAMRADDHYYHCMQGWHCAR